MLHLEKKESHVLYWITYNLAIMKLYIHEKKKKKA